MFRGSSFEKGEGKELGRGVRLIQSEVSQTATLGEMNKLDRVRRREVRRERNEERGGG